ncbi:raffinose/stachyose/melibiose transport system permease protein [Paenibacillus forsythiae]|uniref:Raffinose/stachyose/melibiose transport system permease protein n=1 Tax=Paenibacillus forsythiae TaxID=365616 RepID=A0ABU3H5M3_9BACL|nr:sugar ABC transporter permease [Paenibacillus forsythiae]MDT3426006.1 raffinose/stachyose/melibiose transport system permease protein [Paenibacillus forsythiae]
MQIFLRHKWIIAAGLIPAIAIYTMFSIYPILSSVYYSFFKWDGFSPKQWYGLQNYANLIEDGVFWQSIRNNLYFVLFSVLGEIPLGLYLAMMLHGKLFRRDGIFRTVFFMPVVISTIVVSLIWNMFYNYQFGLVNTALRAVGLDDWAQNWLGNPKLAIFVLCIVVVWQYTGLYMVIFLAALQNVPSEVLEAAELDGAVGIKRTWNIVVPIIADTIFASVVLCISGALRAFDLIYVMTNGGPSHSTEVGATYMFSQTFSSMKYGYGSAISTAIIIISFGLIIISQFILRSVKR